MVRAERRKQESARNEPDLAVVSKRRSLELARVHVMHQIENAHADAHREMLRRTLSAVEQQIKKLA
jgi:hypothetical protein